MTIPNTRITLLGAAGSVTGSAYLVETNQTRLLIDFGMFQGTENHRALNVLPKCLRPTELNAVLLTHAHLDHTGRLPILGKAGFTGPILATPATIELATLILRDSARVQAQDFERLNRKRVRAGKEPVPPLYSGAEVESLLPRFQPAPYNTRIQIAEDIQAEFVEAGHMLGSSSIRLTIGSAGMQRRIVFSGDIGPRGTPILRDAEPFQQAELVFLESTYGDRDHRPFPETIAEFNRIIGQTVARKGKILIPTFAVGRAQLLLLLLGDLFRHHGVEPFPVYLDSPMAIEAGGIYQRHAELFDDEMLAFIRERPLERDLETLTATVTAEESKRINDCQGPCLVMAGAGMCNAGRILHHLRNNLFKPETSVIIVGFQGQGTLGRQLVDGAKKVRIFGEEVAVKAGIHTLNGFSAHAGQTDLLNWVDPLLKRHSRVVLTHGEAKGRDALAALIDKRHGIKSTLPNLGDVIEI